MYNTLTLQDNLSSPDEICMYSVFRIPTKYVGILLALS